MLVPNFVIANLFNKKEFDRVDCLFLLFISKSTSYKVIIFIIMMALKVLLKYIMIRPDRSQ
jgi:hypothetical protein